MIPHRGSGVAPSRLSAPYRRSNPTAMACPVNAVDITATIMTPGSTVSTRESPKSPIGSRHSPMSRVIGMNMVSSNCSPLRSRRVSSSLVCAASIVAAELGRGSGEKVPGSKRFSASRRSLATLMGLLWPFDAVSFMTLISVIPSVPGPSIRGRRLPDSVDRRECR